MNRRFAFLVALSVLARAAPPEKGQEVIQAAIAALGGTNFEQLRTRVETGRAYSFYREQLSGLSAATLYTEYLASRPATGVAVRQRQVYGKKKNEFSILFLETEGYEVTFRGARPLPDERLKRYFTSTENDVFYILRVRRNEPGMQFDYEGGDVVNNAPVDRVTITDSQDRKVRIDFDQNTHLPVRQSVSSFNPQDRGRDEEVTEFAKYRDAGHGVTWPFSVRRDRNGERVFELYSEHVEVNPELPADLFAIGPGTKLLKRIE